ncbi:MAG: hypothetical protein J0L86_10800 [Flavobacteriales bacterium]|nr:hypothetical protein [Flavobacteriales bacterium]
MKYALSIDEYNEFLNIVYFNNDFNKEDYCHIEEHYENSKYWEITICGINHLLCILLERLEKKGKYKPELIDFIYELDQECSFLIQESDEHFIENLYKYPFNGSTLEQHLIEVQNNL